ncbi:type II 3-dehydroquinate dehydratase [Pseudoxanthomonas sacheonensis]|uniref:type II 3-dehydroquinate dehydratase n=1 Tax=Pseudoxanthomonas sacheonensis TaxID=443615 RepID=UPI0013D3FF3B|nr:type II 3-dehydroquinate dehydratase [Pseudoxanthomonas sacheonensis]KAF1706910.1 3-dehydroquinate dehydratase [Pseudoxanthomonas sacheonensis]
MSIVIIRGPEASGLFPRTPPALPREVLGALVERAVCAGKTIAVRACGSEREVLHSLRIACRSRAEIALLDPGACVRSAHVQQALKDMDMPYIEVHDDSCDAPEATMRAGNGNRLAVVNGYMAQSYTLALDMALEHLGCAECECDVHVGT